MQTLKQHSCHDLGSVTALSSAPSDTAASPETFARTRQASDLSYLAKNTSAISSISDPARTPAGAVADEDSEDDAHDIEAESSDEAHDIEAESSTDEEGSEEPASLASPSVPMDSVPSTADTEAAPIPAKRLSHVQPPNGNASINATPGCSSAAAASTAGGVVGRQRGLTGIGPSVRRPSFIQKFGAALLAPFNNGPNDQPTEAEHNELEAERRVTAKLADGSIDKAVDAAFDAIAHTSIAFAIAAEAHRAAWMQQSSPTPSAPALAPSQPSESSRTRTRDVQPSPDNADPAKPSPPRPTLEEQVLTSTSMSASTRSAARSVARSRAATVAPINEDPEEEDAQEDEEEDAPKPATVTNLWTSSDDVLETGFGPNVKSDRDQSRSANTTLHSAGAAQVQLTDVKVSISTGGAPGLANEAPLAAPRLQFKYTFRSGDGALKVVESEKKLEVALKSAEVAPSPTSPSQKPPFQVGVKLSLQEVAGANGQSRKKAIVQLTASGTSVQPVPPPPQGPSLLNSAVIKLQLGPNGLLQTQFEYARKDGATVDSAGLFRHAGELPETPLEERQFLQPPPLLRASTQPLTPPPPPPTAQELGVSVAAAAAIPRAPNLQPPPLVRAPTQPLTAPPPPPTESMLRDYADTKAAIIVQKRFRGRSIRLKAMVRFALEGLPRDAAARAAHSGLDALGDLISDALGKNVWARALHNAPPEWEEEQMLFAIRDAVGQPARSSYLWLLATPTTMEMTMLTAFQGGAAPPPSTASLPVNPPPPRPPPQQQLAQGHGDYISGRDMSTSEYVRRTVRRKPEACVLSEEPMVGVSLSWAIDEASGELKPTISYALASGSTFSLTSTLHAYTELRVGAECIQKHARARAIRMAYLEILHIITSIQGTVRGSFARARVKQARARLGAARRGS